MLVQIRLEGKGLAAAGAGVRLGVRMGLYVGAQIRFVRKGLAADAALEGLLARMGAYVALQQPGPREALAAILALAALVMGAHMHREGRHRHVHLFAVGTMSRLLVHN